MRKPPTRGRLLLATICLLAISLPVFASYKKAIMRPWLGASKDELTAKWGSANDFVKIDNDFVLYAYTSSTCIVTFALKSDVVVSWTYDGSHCPRNKREKRSIPVGPPRAFDSSAY